MADLNDIIEKLKTKKEELAERLERVESSLRKTHDRDWAEQAQERENEEVVVALEANTRAELNMVNEALGRVDLDEYGKCTVCDGPIRVERLEALPYTDRCFNCASELE